MWLKDFVLLIFSWGIENNKVNYGAIVQYYWVEPVLRLKISNSSIGAILVCAEFWRSRSSLKKGTKRV